MANMAGVIHGGLIASAVDSIMGLFVFALNGNRNSPTITLQTNYLRPIPPDKRLVIRTHVDYIGRTTAAVAVEVWIEGHPKNLTTTATGVYYIASRPLPDNINDSDAEDKVL
jgi:acyl-coenzyme A thioesterase PaaI-like protein